MIKVGMRRVILESPYAGDIAANIAYARQAMRDSLFRGEAPLASHLLYTQVGILDDALPEDRSHGILAGHEWIPFAEAMVVYMDLGFSEGMLLGIDRAKSHGLQIEFRRLLD